MASTATASSPSPATATAAAPTHLDSEEVVHVTGLAQVNRATGIYYPASWRTMDQADADFGSSSPVVITVPGATPSTHRRGHREGRTLLPAQPGEPRRHGAVTSSTSRRGRRRHERSAAALAAYVSASGVHVVMNASNTRVRRGVRQGIVSVLVTPGAPPTAKARGARAGGNTSPIATSTDGKDETIVWYMNGNGLNGVDGDTGASVFAAARAPAAASAVDLAHRRQGPHRRRRRRPALLLVGALGAAPAPDERPGKT